nr:MAG TPA: tail tube protein [Caudoviricetes sp.]
MASIGMQGMKYALLVTEGEGAETTYQTAKEFIGAISANITPNSAEASLYGDDKLMEYSSSFQNATVSLTAADDNDEVFADLLGRKKETSTGRYRSNINDVAPYVGFGYIVSKMINGQTKYRAQFFPKMRFKVFVPEASTKGENLEFKTITVEGMTMPSKYGDWESHIDVDSLTAAQDELNKYFTQPLSDPNT